MGRSGLSPPIGNGVKPIEQLYMKEGKKLREVMVVMENNHQFYAI